MAKIQARNVDDALFARIEQSAMKNERSLEGEIRLALAAAYPPPEQIARQLTLRESWLKETDNGFSPCWRNFRRTTISRSTPGTTGPGCRSWYGLLDS